MKKYLVCILTVMLFQNSFSAVLLNEVMFDPSGSEYHDEFIEIYNDSDLQVDLSSWKVGDQDEIDGLQPLESNSGMVLAPHAYAIILDSSYPANSQLYDQLIPAGVLKLMIDDGSFGKYGLSNSVADTVRLVDNFGVLADQVQYVIDQEPGFSEERSSFTANSWLNSKVLLGTPGKKNSVVTLDYDLSLVLKLEQTKNRSAAVKALIKNIGTKTVNGCHLEIAAGGNIVQEFDSGILQSGDSLNFTFNAPLTAGSILLTGNLEVENDEQLNNNRDSLLCFNQLPVNSISLNEFMKKPSAGNCEWLEVFNASADNLLSADLVLRDQTSALLPLNGSLVIPPQEYLVIAKDSTILNLYSIPTEKIIYLKNLPALSDEDALYICDKEGGVLDSLIWQNIWSEEYDNSIEKINPQLSASDPANWVPAVKKATPGTVNSVYQELSNPDGENSVGLNNQLISPNEDGKNDQLILNYQFNSAYIYLSAAVYNLQGHLMNQIADNQYQSAAGSLVFNCRGKNGNLLADGAYILFISAKKSDGKTQEFKQVFYVVK